MVTPDWVVLAVVKRRLWSHERRDLRGFIKLKRRATSILIKQKTVRECLIKTSRFSFKAYICVKKDVDSEIL